MAFTPFGRRAYRGSAPKQTLGSDPGATGLTITLAADPGTTWPDGSTGPFFITIDRTGTNERVLVTSRTGPNLTVAALSDRGMDGTVAVPHSAGVDVEHTFSGIDADEANATAAGVLGKVVAKGDLLFGSALRTLTKIAVGSNDQGLIADSAQATGAKWADVVLPTKAQTLTNKTLTTPTIADLSNAQHDHSAANKGGAAVVASHTHTLPVHDHHDAATGGLIPLGSLSGAGSDYTPVWSSTSGAPPAVGNGTLVGRYFQVGKFVVFTVELTIGSTTTKGTTGAYRMSLPVAARTGVRWTGTSYFAGHTNTTGGWTIPGGATEFGASFPTVGSAAAQTTWAPSNPPFDALAAGDLLVFSGFYEAA